MLTPGLSNIAVRYVEHVELLVEVLMEWEMQVNRNPDLIVRLHSYLIDGQIPLCYQKIDINLHPVVQTALVISQRKSEDIDLNLAICGIGIVVPAYGLDTR
ncbi:MAG: hypothetical protein Q9212_003576 [Teloschistes hypoglaucus]